MKLDPNDLEVLLGDECLHLLGSQSIGRLALCAKALPVILPVNYVMLGDRLVIRTALGSSLARWAKDAVVAFEADEIDSATGVGWSVMIQGFARELSDASDLEAVAAAPVLTRWLDPARSVHMEVSTDVISGRRCADGSPQAKQASRRVSNPA